MEKKVIWIGVILLVGIFGLFTNEEGEIEDEEQIVENSEASKEEIVEEVVLSKEEVAPEKKEFDDWEKYNYDFVDENVKRILSSMIGANGKTAFYLPPTGYINVSRGSKFGVAFALNNPNPSGENFFEFDWTVDESVVENCGVSEKVAQGWIERGWTSFGKIPKGWIDHMTVYFAFPNDTPVCNLKYNFVINKDGILYDSKTVEFNIVD